MYTIDFLSEINLSYLILKQKHFSLCAICRGMHMDNAVGMS